MSNKRKLLYVDDEETNLYLFRLSMKDEFELYTAESGEEGLKILTENHDIDLIISDIKMPGMNGIEFIDRARTVFGTKKRYFLMTALMKPQSEWNEIIDMHLIDGYFSKPFDKAELVEGLNSAFRD